MNHNRNNGDKQNKETQTEAANKQENQKIAKTYDYQTPAIQGALYVLWAIQNKRYTTGARLFYEEVSKHTGVKKESYKQTTAFLEGAGVVVNDVVITSKVPGELVDRYGILTNE